MRCSGGSKCDCTLFQGGRQAKKCKSCRHDRGSHYNNGNERSDDDDDDDDSNNANDTNDDDSSDGDDGDSNDNAKQPSTSTKNRMTVSSLVANLINDGEHSRAEVENAKREAKAGLTRQQVSLTFTG